MNEITQHREDAANRGPDTAMDLATAVKVGSAIRHLQEALGPGGHQFDLEACRGLVSDPSVVEWMARLDAVGLLPVMRGGES